MKIIMLTRRAYPDIGGVEKHIKEISGVLEKRGHRISVFADRDINYPHIKFLGLLFIWFWMLKNFKLFRDADIVHAHDVAIWYLPLRSLLFRKPFYVTFHGWEGKFPIPLRYRWLRRISSVIAWGNICVGKYIEKWYKIKADYIIYGAVYKKFKYQSASPFGSELRVEDRRKNSKIILFLGRLQEDTGLPTILKAFQAIKEKHPEIEVLFLGDGPLRDEAEKHGTVIGFKKDILPWLKKSRFVFTSGYLSMLEVMATGRLVFAMYDSPLKHDTLEMSPFSRHAVVMSDPQKLAQKIDYFLKNPKKERDIIVSAYKWAHRQTWDKVTDTYLKLWRLSF